MEKTIDLVEAARRMLKDAGFENCDQFFGRRVSEGVLRLADLFQRENFSAVVGRLVVALFSRIARGSPPTPEFLKEVWVEIERFAQDEPYDDAAEKARWIHKRYPMINWAGDLHGHVKEMVFPRQTFAGAPLVRDDPEPTPTLVDDEPPKPTRKVHVSELRKMVEDGKLIQAIKLYHNATGKGLKESKDFIHSLRDEPLELVDDRKTRPPDHYGAALPSPPVFSSLDHYGSGLVFAKTDFVPGRMPEEIEIKNIKVDMDAIDAAIDAAKEEVERKMDKTKAVVTVIKEFCKDMESFTSLDISNRAKGLGLVARHREVAELVRAAFANGEMDQFGYVRDMISVTLPGGGNAQAYLYRHVTVPADDYKNRAQVAIKPQVQPVAPQDDDDDQPALPTPIIPQNLVPPRPTAQATVPVVGRLTRVLNTSSVTRTQKGDGRLEVPHVWLARLGWQVGDTVSAVRNGNSLILKTSIQPGEQAVRSFTVDRWNRIRITTKALNEAGIHFGTGGQHIMTLRTNDIKID